MLKKNKIKNCPKGKSYLLHYVSTIFMHLFLSVEYVDQTYFKSYLLYYVSTIFMHLFLSVAYVDETCFLCF